MCIRDRAQKAQEFLLQGSQNFPAVFNPALLSGANSPYNNGDYNGNKTPLYSFGDTLSWTRGTHAFKFGGELRLTRSIGYNNIGPAGATIPVEPVLYLSLIHISEPTRLLSISY